MLELMRSFLALSFLLLPLFTYAQDEAPADTVKIPAAIEELEEIQLMIDVAPTISLDESDLGDASSQSISSLLTAGRDPYFSAATFNWGISRFRIRGYDNDNFITYMNGVPMDNLDNGFSAFFLWNGLNDVLRNRDNSLGLRPNTYAFGNIGGMFNIDSRASKQWKQFRVNYASTNRNYTNRLMATYSTGITPKGWAFTGSASRRWAQEGYITGTFYDAWAYFLSAEKIFNARHSLALTSFGAPTKYGRSGASIRELQDLSGSPYYNPFWGYQNGEKRNSSVSQNHQPTFILTHDWKPSNKSSVITAASYTFGQRSISAIDWYNAPDPRADYYRDLPSFITTQDPEQALLVEELLRENEALRQIQWDRFYNVNRNNIETIKNVNGIEGNDVTGKRSRYILEQRVTATQRFNFNTVVNTLIGERYNFSGGLSYQFQKNRQYKEVGDLLGGEFYVDLNQFAERDFPDAPGANQNDINRPNRVLYEGDRFGYDYDYVMQKAAAWGQLVAKWNHVDAFVALELSNTNYFRKGYVRNGLFPDNSEGKSEVFNFFNYAVKAGLTYKIDGRNYLFANGTYQTRASYINNIFVSPRTRNTTVPDPRNETIRSVEAGYVLNAPRVKARFTGFMTEFLDQTRTLTFFHDDFRNFVNYSLTNIDKMHMGGELGLEAKIYKGLSLNLAGTLGRYFYTSRQNAYVTQDNSQEVLSEGEVIYSKFFKLGGSPQRAATAGFSYRSPKYWFFNVNFNYFDDIWLDINPIRRTTAAVDLLETGSPLYQEVIAQEQLSGQFTMDFFGGYSLKLDKYFGGIKKPTYLYINLGITNLTNNQRFITGGYEQLRFDFDDRRVEKFPNRYSYAYGINYFLSLTLRM
jgi:uncharacterized protein YnzC (UPF0291/DUF896 family)